MLISADSRGDIVIAQWNMTLYIGGGWSGGDIHLRGAQHQKD